MIYTLSACSGYFYYFQDSKNLTVQDIQVLIKPEHDNIPAVEQKSQCGWLKQNPPSPRPPKKVTEKGPEKR